MATPQVAVAPADADSLRKLRSYLSRGRYRLVDSLATAYAVRLENRTPPDSLGLAQCLDLMLDARAHMGTPLKPEWIEQARRTVALKERLFGPEHRELAVSLNRLGTLLADDFQLDAALPYYKRALAISEAAYGHQDLQVSRVLVNIAILERDRGDWVQGQKDYRRAMAIWDAALKTESPFFDQHVNSLTDHMWNTGEYAGIRSLFERGLAIWETLSSPGYEMMKSTLDQATVTMKGGGDWRAAAPYIQLAGWYLEQQWGSDSPDVALAYNGIALFYARVGDLAVARPMFEKAIQMWEASVGPDHPDVAWGHSGLGSLLLGLGRLEEARAHFERAVEIRERAFGRNHPLVAYALGQLAYVASELGDLPETRRLAEQALAIDQAVLGPHHPEVAHRLVALAFVEYAAWDSIAVVRRHLLQALESLERSVGPRELDLTEPLLALTAIAREEGDFDEALAYARRAESVVERELGGHASGGFDHRTQLALTLFAMGDLRSAATLFHADLQQVLRDQGPREMDAAALRSHLGEVYAALGQDSAAFGEAVAAEEIARYNIAVLIQGLPERLALSASAKRPAGMHLAASLAARRPPEDPLVAHAWDLWVRSRLMVLDEMADRRRRASLPEDTVGRAVKLRATQSVERLANLLARGPGNDPSLGYAQVVAEAQRELEDAQRQLARVSARFRERQHRDSVGFRDVAAALPAGSALVGYARTLAHRAPDGRLKPRELHPPCYVAFVLRPGGGAPAIVSLGGARGIDSLVTRWRDAAAKEAEFRDPRNAEAYYRKAGDALRQRIWDPIAPHVRGAERVFVVPDGAIHLVSLATLPDSGGRYLVESGPLLHYLSSERDLLQSAAAPASGGSLLAIGGPDFDRLPAAADTAMVSPSAAGPHGATAANPFRGETTRCGDFASVRFAPLSATGPEAREAAALWDRRERARPGGVATEPAAGAPLVLTGASAREAAFKQLAPGRGALHLATHGFFLGASCGGGAGTSGQRVDAGLRAARAAASENPLLVSGLALAGFNRRREAPAGGDDGVLTAEEIAALDLASVDWVVLSACDTGVGSLASGEGVLGLRRAFQIAGARTIIMSLWKIRDQATRRWMRALYHARWVEGLPTDQAMRAASLDVLRESRRRNGSTHPANWGAFIAVGDWR